MIGLSAQERAKVREADAIKRRVRAEAKAARPKKVAPVRTDKPAGALRERRPRERDNGHLQFIRRQPCIACAVGGYIQTLPTEAAHVRSSYPEPGWSYTGKSEKPDDWRTAPLCGGPAGHHAAQHARGDESAWWAELGLYPPAVVAVLVKARAEGRDGPEVIRKAVEAGRFSSTRPRPDALGEVG